MRNIMTQQNYCSDFQYDFNENIGLSVAFGICFLVGIFLVFAGYRFFRTSLFLQTFSFASLLAYLLISHLLDQSILVNGAISAGCGLCLGIVAMFVTTLGLLVTSLIQSVYIATCILYLVHIVVTVTNIFVAPTIAFVSLILLSIPILRWQRACAIVYICSFGAILMMLGVDFYIDLSMLRHMAFENITLRHRSVEPCWFSWIVLALWPFMMFVGCIVQFMKTARDFDHRYEPHWYKRNKAEPKLRLLSDKSDIIAQAWMHPPLSPSISDKHPYASTYFSQREDEVFLVQNTTTV